MLFKIRIFRSCLYILIGFLTVINCYDSPPQYNPVITTGDDAPVYEINLPDYMVLIQQYPQFIDPEYPNYSANILLMTGEDGNLLVDTGYPYASAATGDTVIQLTGDPIHYIINTHHHHDHSGGNSQIVGIGTVVGHEDALSVFEQMTPGARIDVFNDQHTIQYNNEEIRCYAMPMGHSNSDIVIHFTESKVLCLGDLYISEAFPSAYGPDASVQTMVAHLDSIVTMFPTDVVIIPGHGRMTTMEELADYIEMLKETIEVVLNHMQQGKTADQMIIEDILSPWSQWANYHSGLGKDDWIFTVHRSYAPEPDY